MIAAWRKVAALGCEELVTEAWRQRIELAEKRLPLVRTVRQIPEGSRPISCDRRLLAAWKPELLDDCADVESWRRRTSLRCAAAGSAPPHRQGDPPAPRCARSSARMEDPSLADYPLAGRVEGGGRRRPGRGWRRRRR